MKPEEFGIRLAVCQSFDFINWLKKKECKDIGLDYDTFLFRFKQEDDMRKRICSR